MKKTILLLSLLLLSLGYLSAQRQIKVMQYNLLQFGNSCSGVALQDKYTWLGIILDDVRPDIFTVNEINPNVAYASGIVQLSFKYTSDMVFGPTTNTTGSSIINRIFYNEELFDFEGVESITTTFRDINIFTLRIKPEHIAPGQDTTRLHLIVAHLKAGNSSQDANTRGVQSNQIMKWISSKLQGENVLVMGDMNTYFPAEVAFQNYVFHPDTTIRLWDPSGKELGWGGAANTIVHTQSTRSSSPDCGSGGGMDDRFDMILASKQIQAGSKGVSYLPNSYLAYGNDGNSYNQELNCPSGGPVPITVCGSLKQFSDHLPVVWTLSLDNVTSRAPDLEARGVSLQFANPIAGDDWRLRISAPRELLPGLEVLLLAADGRLISRQRLQTPESEVRFPVSTLNPGIYFLRLIHPTGGSLNKTLIKLY